MLLQLGKTSVRKLQKYAIAFPGQGIIENGLLAPFKKDEHFIKPTLDLADEVFKDNFASNLFNTDPSFNKKWLLKTSNAQPAILISSIAICEVIKRKYNIDIAKSATYILGHSLGEYTSLGLSGVLNVANSLRLVRDRGLLMEKMFPNEGHGMMAVLFKPPSFPRVLNEASDYVANINSYQQLVLSGKLDDVKKRIASINRKERIILRSVELPVRIPFHTSYLSSIEGELHDRFHNDLQQESVPIVSNLTGEVSVHPFSQAISANSKPVQWVRSIEFLLANDVRQIINIGPGSSLSSLNSKFDILNVNLNSISSIESFVKRLES